MKKIINHPEDIEKGRIYTSLSEDVDEGTIYLGVRNPDLRRNSLVIVSAPEVKKNSIGEMVIHDPDFSIWGRGFEEHEYVWE